MSNDCNLVVVDFKTGTISADGRVTHTQHIMNEARAFSYTRHPIVRFIEKCRLLRRIDLKEEELILFWASQALANSVLQDDSINLQLREVEAVDNVTLMNQITQAWHDNTDIDIKTWPYMRLDEIKKRLPLETPDMSPNAWFHLLACFRMVRKSLKRDRLTEEMFANEEKQVGRLSRAITFIKKWFR